MSSKCLKPQCIFYLRWTWADRSLAWFPPRTCWDCCIGWWPGPTAELRGDTSNELLSKAECYQLLVLIVDIMCYIKWRGALVTCDECVTLSGHCTCLIWCLIFDISHYVIMCQFWMIAWWQFLWMLSLVSFSLYFFGIVYAMVKPQPVKLVEFTIAFYCIFSFCCETQCWKDQRQSAAAAWVAAHENDKVRALTPAWARRWVDVPCSRPAPPAPRPAPTSNCWANLKCAAQQSYEHTHCPHCCTTAMHRACPAAGHIQFNINIMIDYPGYKHFKWTIWSKM